MKCYIDGIAYAVKEGSVYINNSVKERSTASFTIIDKTNLVNFSQGQSVWLTEGEEFEGYILIPKRDKQEGFTYWYMNCSDNIYLADKRIISKSYTDEYAGDIVKDLIKEKLLEEGVDNGCEGLEFDGVGDFVSTSLFDTEDFGLIQKTIEIRTIPSETGQYMLFSTNQSGDSNDRLYCWTNSDIWSINIGDNAISSTAPVVIGKEVLISITINNDNADIYLDGELIQNKVFVPFTTAGPLYLGKHGESNSYYYKGIIKEFRAWNRALTQQEIQDNMSKTFPSDRSGLIAHYLFKEGEGTTLKDYSGNNNDGTINGATWKWLEQPTFTRSSEATKEDGSVVNTDEPRFEEGKFGKALMIEEGATNLLSGNLIATDAIKGDYNGWTIIGTGNDTRKYLNTSSIPVLPNVTYTFSCIYWSSTSFLDDIYIQFDGTGYPEGNVYIQPTKEGQGQNIMNIDLGNGWYKRIGSVTTTSDTANITQVFFDSDTDGLEVFIANLQIEQKPYPTSFIDGSRSIEIMSIPVTSIDPNNGTFETWCYIPQTLLNRSDTAYLRVFQIGNASAFGIMLMYLPNVATNKWYLSLNDGTTTQYYQTTYLDTPEGWHLFTVTWDRDEDEIKLYIDGDLKLNPSSPPFQQVFEHVYLGGITSAANCLNALFDSVRISNKARTAEEILDEYNSNSPFAEDEYTTYILNFNDTVEMTEYIEQGPIIKEAQFNYISISRAITSLADKIGYYWNILKIGNLKRLYFRDFEASKGAWKAEESLVQDIIVDGSGPSYRNTQYVRGPKDETDEITETEKGDGSKRTFPVSLPIARVPTIDISIGGGAWTSQTIGIKGLDTGKNFYWSKGDKSVTQDENDTLLTSVDEVRIKYKGLYSIVVKTANTQEILSKANSQGNSGIVENVVDNPYVFTKDAAFQESNNLIATHSVDSMVVNYKTRKSGLKVGQLQPISFPNYGVYDEELLIENIEIEDIGDDFIYAITAVKGPLQGTWVKMFMDIATKGETFIIRENISENETLVVLQTFSRDWNDTDNPNMMKEIYAGDSLLPSDDLYPMISINNRLKYVELLDSSGGFIIRKEVIKQIYMDSDTMVSTIFVLPTEAIANIGKIAFYGGQNATTVQSSGIKLDEQTFNYNKTELEALQIDKTDNRLFVPMTGTLALDEEYMTSVDDSVDDYISNSL